MADLIAGPENPKSPITLRIGPEPRWFEVHRLPSDAHVLLLLTDQTAQVESGRRHQRQLRHQRMISEVAEALASTDHVEETTAELLACFGDHLELASATWASNGSEDEDWQPVARWSHDGSPPKAPAGTCLVENEARLAGGLPVIDPSGQTPVLVVPILVNGTFQHALEFIPLGGGVWEEDLIDLMQRIADTIGRRLEEQAAELERETWAARRGALERSEALAQLTSGVTHDFNGLLFAMLGRFELLRLKVTDPAVLAELDELERTIHEAKRMADRLRQALTGSETSNQKILVQPELSAIAATIDRLMPSRLEFHATLALPQEPVEIVGRTNTIQQIALNLAANARQAVSTHGRIQFGARLLGDGRLEIRVDDDGPGIPAEDRERLMEPFETGDESDGVGLGLAICRRLVTEAGGEFRLDDSPLGGLAARAIMPIESASQAAAGSLVANPVDPRQVVVIEDNDIIRDVFVRVFEGSGAQVHADRDAREIEKTLAEHPSVDLLVIDIDLPHRTGIETIHDLRSAGIEVPCLLVTGGTAEPPRLKNLGFLRKPFKIDVLREAARRLLAERT